MTKILAALAVLYISSATATIQWKDLSLKFGLFDGYWKTPLTLQGVLQKDNKYTLMTKDSELNLNFYSYPNDPRIALGFDTYNNIAAVRIGFIKSDLASRATNNGVSFDYTYDDKALYSSGTFWDTEVFYSDILFASPEVLAAGGRSNPQGLVADDVYLRMNGEWTLIPKYECSAPNIGFVRQGCFDGMGIHYIYNMSKTMDCNQHQGPFLLYEHGDLVGLGFFPFGTFSSKDKVWFEDPPAFLTKVFAPDAPDCFTDWAGKYGVTSFHIFFKKHPKLTVCMLGAGKSACK